MNKLLRLINEMRAGRVLSSANEKKLREAIDALMSVLEQLGLDEDNDRAAGPALEMRTIPVGGLQIRAEGEGGPLISGHAALFNTKSVFLYGFREVILPGAFKDSIESGDIRALWQHDTGTVLGRTKSGTLRLWEDNQGLAFELTPPDTQAGRDAVTLIERGDVDQMSFGFRVPPGGDSWAYDEDDAPVRYLRTVDLMEISPVTWAAYPDTGVGVMRSAPEWVQRALTQGVDDKADDHARARVEEMLREHELEVFLMEVGHEPH